VTPNPQLGKCPPDAEGQRVRVILRKDAETMTQPVYADALNPTCKPGWAADGRDGCCWKLRAKCHPVEYDVLYYEVI
jgi:hypothetical protein